MQQKSKMHCLKMNIFVLGLISVAVLLSTTGFQTGIDGSRYDEGRKQFELVQEKSQMPKYGKCWRDAMMFIESGCRRLDDVVQTRLALYYLNCFLQIQGRSVYPCSEDSPLESCVEYMNDADRGSFATFFAHTQDMCYFLQAQVWQQHTENTISRLESSSSNVAEQLESSHRIQQDIVNSQNVSLQNQEKLMHHAQNLSDTINISSQNVHSLFEDLKKSTIEQQHIIGGLSTQLVRLQTTIFGEISGFYSLFYYILSVFICYLLTSASRLSAARFWLFMMLTINVVLEQTVMRWVSSSTYIFSKDDLEHEQLYWLQGQCRRICLVLALLVLAMCAYMYQDINAVNNQLLVEIRRQNSDLWRLVTDNLKTFVWKKENVTSNRRQEAAESTDSDYTSDNNEGGCSDAESDHTFILPENREDTDTDSLRTVLDDGASVSDRMSLLGELCDLRNLVPKMENSSHDIQSWLNSSIGNNELEKSYVTNHGGSPYNLRPRRSGQTNISPATQVESARSFSRTVHQMQQIAEKNSRLIRAIQQQSRQACPVTDENHVSSSGLEVQPNPGGAQTSSLDGADRGSRLSRRSRVSSRK